MAAKDILDLSNKKFVDLLVDRRRVLVIVVMVATAMLSAFIPELHTDPSLKSGIDTSSQAYLDYRRYVEAFGSEEFILVAIKSEIGTGDPRMLTALESITRALENRDKIDEVVSLANMRVFQQHGDRFGNYPVLRTVDGAAALPEPAVLARIRKALPVTDYLISDDLKTVGVLIRMDDRWRLEPAAVRPLIKDIDRVIRENLPPDTRYTLVGAPLIRQAIVRYNIQTGVVFGVLCILLATIVAVYIFRSIRVTAITNIILGVCVLWILGLMSLTGIPLNSTTALSFGFVPITTIEIVIHMVIRYHIYHQSTPDKAGAVKQTVRWLARPCLICSATTAVGFGSLMVSSIPMVRQLGFIMSVGIMTSYVIAFILTPAFVMNMKSLDVAEGSGSTRGWLDSLLQITENAIFRYHRAFVVIGLVVTAVLFAGTPFIRSDIQLLRMLSESTPEVQDIKFVEKNLTAATSLELMLEGEHGAFRRPETWKRVLALETRLLEIPEVVSTDSFLPLMGYLNGTVDPGAHSTEGLFTKPALIPQLLAMTSLSAEGQKMRQRFLDEGLDRLRISVRIKNSQSVTLGETIERVRSTAASVMEGVAEPTVTGDLAVLEGQTSRLVKDQVVSMLLAALIITVLMMIQLGSPTLGLISLIPNIPPVAAVFGIMGWFGISLDAVTVFAATVAIGLAVDNTIHFLTQLKREIRLSGSVHIDDCVRSAYRLTAKQIASWTTVTLLGFLALAISPFRPVVLFGILGCSALCLGIFGDLIFIQSLILSSPAIRNSITRLIEKEMLADR